MRPFIGAYTLSKSRSGIIYNVVLSKNQMNQIKIDNASKSDLKEILDLQKEAYVSEAKIYNDFSIPPLTETIEEIEESFKNHVFLKISLEGEILGSVRAFETNGVCQIGRLIVKQTHQNQGFGKRLLNEIESKFPESEKFELFTGEKSTKNLYLYQKCGYKVVRQQKVSQSLTLIFLNKNNKLSTTKYSSGPEKAPGR